MKSSFFPRFCRRGVVGGAKPEEEATGTYLNPGTDRMPWSMSTPFHVDKSMIVERLIRRLEKDGKFLCVSRAGPGDEASEGG